MVMLFLLLCLRFTVLAILHRTISDRTTLSTNAIRKPFILFQIKPSLCNFLKTFPLNLHVLDICTSSLTVRWRIMNFQSILWQPCNPMLVFAFSHPFTASMWVHFSWNGNANSLDEKETNITSCGFSGLAELYSECRHCALNKRQV